MQHLGPHPTPTESEPEVQQGPQVIGMHYKMREAQSLCFTDEKLRPREVKLFAKYRTMNQLR